MSPKRSKTIFGDNSRAAYDPKTLKYYFAEERKNLKNLCLCEESWNCFFTKKEAVLYYLKNTLDYEKHFLREGKKELEGIQGKIDAIQKDIEMREAEIKNLTQKIAKIK